MNKACRVDLAALAKETAYHWEERKRKGTWYSWYLNSISSHAIEHEYIRSEHQELLRKSGSCFMKCTYL